MNSARIFFAVAASTAALCGQTQVAATLVPAGASGPAMGRPVVTGQPYSAQQETETIRTLADGTHITSRPQSVTLYRDSSGRTRSDRTFSPDGPANPPPFEVIEIEDPMAGYRYQLDSQARVARRTAITPMRRTAPPNLPPNLAPNVTRTIPAPAQIDPEYRPQITQESLGTKTFEGVSAEGRKTTTVWPVGSFGNDRPVTAYTEVWTSRELGIEVSRTTIDPRLGDSRLKLLNISRAEPDPSLFQPPSDYRIQDATPNQ